MDYAKIVELKLGLKQLDDFILSENAEGVWAIQYWRNSEIPKPTMVELREWATRNESLLLVRRKKELKKAMVSRIASKMSEIPNLARFKAKLNALEQKLTLAEDAIDAEMDDTNLDSIYLDYESQIDGIKVDV